MNITVSTEVTKLCPYVDEIDHGDVTFTFTGRVNSFKRVDYARAIGCSTVDGTFLIFGPRVNLPRLLGWVDRMDQAPMLV